MKVFFYTCVVVICFLYIPNMVLSYMPEKMFTQVIKVISLNGTLNHMLSLILTMSAISLLVGLLTIYIIEKSVVQRNKNKSTKKQ